MLYGALEIGSTQGGVARDARSDGVEDERHVERGERSGV